ncbi:MAG: hypothetical protein AAF989_06755 [Planctomycetota bacterium]
MNRDEVLPNSYEQWRQFIEFRCGIRLTRTYIHQRLSELQSDKHSRTREFAQLYGADHLQRTIDWFRRASDELSGESASHDHG